MRWESIPLLQPYARFSSSILYFLLRAHTLVCFLSIRCICACVHARAIYVSTYWHLLICVYQAGVPPHTVTQTHTVLFNHTSPHVVTQTGHTGTHTDTHTHTQSERENIQYSIVHFSFPFTKSSGESRQLEKRNGGKPS